MRATAASVTIRKVPSSECCWMPRSNRDRWNTWTPRCHAATLEKKHRQSGYTLDDFQRISSEVAGVAMDEWFRPMFGKPRKSTIPKCSSGMAFDSKAPKPKRTAMQARRIRPSRWSNAKAESPSDKEGGISLPRRGTHGWDVSPAVKMDAWSCDKFREERRPI